MLSIQAVRGLPRLRASGTVTGTIPHHLAKLRKDRSYRCRDIAIFRKLLKCKKIGWVGLGRVGLGRVDSTIAVCLHRRSKQLSLCDDGALVLACSAAAEDILNISLNSLFLSDIMMLFLICIMISKKHE